MKTWIENCICTRISVLFYRNVANNVESKQVGSSWSQLGKGLLLRDVYFFLVVVSAEAPYYPSVTVHAN